MGHGAFAIVTLNLTALGVRVRGGMAGNRASHWNTDTNDWCRNDDGSLPG
jgi:hypothetical protein